MNQVKSVGMDIAVYYSMINRTLEQKKNRGPSGPKDGNKSKKGSDLIGEIVSIIDDVVEVQDEGGLIHSFRLVGADTPAEYGELKGSETQELEVGDKVRVNLKMGRLTLIQKMIRSN
jgi:hypothetical protein